MQARTANSSLSLQFHPDPNTRAKVTTTINPPHTSPPIPPIIDSPTEIRTFDLTSLVNVQMEITINDNSDMRVIGKKLTTELSK